jgi:hypothetical protein
MNGPARMPGVVTFLFNYGRVSRLSGGTPDEFFYGYRNLPDTRFRTGLLETHPPSQGLIDETGRVYAAPGPVRWINGKLKPTGLTQINRLLQLSFCGLSPLRRASVIVCITSPWLHALRVLRLLGLVRRPTVGVIIGPFLPATSLRSRIRNQLRRWLDSGADLVFLGEGDIRAYRANINPRPKSATLIQFGIDARFWHPTGGGNADDAGAFAIGNAGRDYTTLLDAWHGRSTGLEIVTRRLDPNASYPPSVHVRDGIWHSTKISDEDVRTMFQRARYVITPLVESSQPCGQSATLQAMACGKPVILTRTAGLWDSENLRDGENCLLVPPGDSAALGAAIDRLESDPEERRRIGANARRAVEEHFSSDRFAHELTELITRRLGPIREIRS